MRRPLTTLALVATCGALALLAAAALAAGGVLGAGARARQSATRSFAVTLSPEPDELSLAQIGFPRGGRQQLSARALRVVVSGPFGDDYLALAAVPGAAGAGAPQALVLLVNRPSPLLEPVSVHMRFTAQRALGTPSVRTLENEFARPASAPRPALCDLRLHGRALSGAQLRTLAARGGALAGFDAASAVAQAYDATCGLAYEHAFEQAVRSPSGAGAPVPSPTPEPERTTTSTGPPVGKLPGEGCVPTPGYACPMS